MANTSPTPLILRPRSLLDMGGTPGSSETDVERTLSSSSTVPNISVAAGVPLPGANLPKGDKPSSAALSPIRIKRPPGFRPAPGEPTPTKIAPSNGPPSPPFPFISSFPIPRPGFLAMPTLDASLPQHELREKMLDYEAKGIPVVVRGFHKLPGWQADMFTPQWLLKDAKGADEMISVRNIHTKQDKDILLTEFIQRCENISDFIPGETERYYGKDAVCPLEWEKWMHSGKVVPTHTLPLGSEDVFRLLTEKDRAETLMTYIGVGGTYTPCHKDLCCSVGQNLMVHTEKEGSAVWYMTERDEAASVSQYFHSLGQEVDLETHVASEPELRTAPFKVYMHRQILGDLICVPQRSCHQVINEGGISIKLSWSRMTMSSLVLAYKSELPIYRRVCRPETYAVKLLIHVAVIDTTTELTKALTASNGKITNHIRSLRDSLQPLLKGYTEILVAEWDPELQGEPLSYDPEVPPDRLLCDFCGADIFHSYFECRKCSSEETGSLVLCSGCYIEGRFCICDVMTPLQIRPFRVLLDARNAAATVLNRTLENDNRELEGYSSDNLRSDGGARVHEAACILLKAMKLQTDAPSKCRDGGVHDVPMAHSINCSGCHKRICFEHLLEKTKVHPAAAVMWHRDDKDKFHSTHASFRLAYTTAVTEMKSKKQNIESLDSWVRLSYAIITYPRCRPSINSKLRMGFFDEDYDHPHPPAELNIAPSQNTPHMSVPSSPTKMDKGKKRAFDASSAAAGDTPGEGPSSQTDSNIIKKRKVSSAFTGVRKRRSDAGSIKKEPGTPSLAVDHSGKGKRSGFGSATLLPAPPSDALPLAILPAVDAPEQMLVDLPELDFNAPLNLQPNAALYSILKDVSCELKDTRILAENTLQTQQAQFDAMMAEYKALIAGKQKAQDEAYAGHKALTSRLLQQGEEKIKALTNQLALAEQRAVDAEAKCRRSEAIIDRLIGDAAPAQSPQKPAHLERRDGQHLFPFTPQPAHNGHSSISHYSG